MPWTETTREQYRRSGLRYPSDLTDAEWALIARWMPARRHLGRPSQTLRSRALARRLEGWLQVLVAHPLRLAVKKGEHLRMTAVLVWIPGCVTPHRASSRIIRDAFSAIMMTAALVLPDTRSGMI